MRKKDKRAKYIIGIDEVGRGPIAGPVTLCALKIENKEILRDFKDSRDSKKHTHEERVLWLKKIRTKKNEGLLDFSISHVRSTVLDSIGLSKAISLAISRCLKKLEVNPNECEIFLDGSLKAPSEFIFQKTIIKGDEKVKVIGLASIVAKVYRDRLMTLASKKYRGYKFEIHKGYGTEEHYKLLRRLGLSEIHRKSFLKNLTPSKSK